MTSLDSLDQLANDVFAGKVVRKDLVRQVKVGANVPVYVLEFLLGKYCASDDDAAIQTGLTVVRQTLRDNFIRPDESEQAKAELKRKGRHRLIDKVDVRLVESEDKFWAHLASFGSNHVHIPEELVYKYDRLLGGGVWCQAELMYSADDDETLKRPFFITSLKPIQIAAFDLAEYAEGRSRFSRDEWLDLIIRSIGLEPAGLSLRQKLLTLVRLIPMAERNYNLIELGPRGTGKSFVYRESSPNSMLISGGKVTVPQLFVKLSGGRPQVGLLGHWDVVAFDEVAALELSDTTVIQMLKDYMESGSFARGKEEMPAEASVVLVGNTSKATDQLVREGHLFADLPKAMIDTAFLDRLHYYLPGWEVPKLDRALFTDHYGFVSDYFAEALQELRKENYVMALDDEFALGAHLSARDERAVRKTVAGFLKILHPHGRWTRQDLREYLELALEGRRRVKEQLRKMAAYEFSRTEFSYIERDSGREIVVPVPEQPSNPDDESNDEPESRQATLTAVVDTTSLIAAGESKRVEFKSTFKCNLHTGLRDDVMELQVVKSVAGFMNQKGGSLLIGVDDHGVVLGLDKDFALTGNKGRDGFENALTTTLDRALGKPAVGTVEVLFEMIDGLDVCRIDVPRSSVPVYANWKGDQQFFFVRTNNGTRPFSMSETVDWVTRHWR